MLSLVTRVCVHAQASSLAITQSIGSAGEADRAHMQSVEFFAMSVLLQSMGLRVVDAGGRLNCKRPREELTYRTGSTTTNVKVSTTYPNLMRPFYDVFSNN